MAFGTNHAARARRTAAFLALVAAAAITLLPAQAHAAHVGCGDVLIQDTTLDSDLVDCPGDGLVIGASGITVDLAGHTIDGTGVGSGGFAVDNEGHDGVTVRNGEIQEFYSAVYLDDADGNVVRDLTIASTGQAVYLQHADRNLIERNVATVTSGSAVYILYAGKDNVIARNFFSGGSGGVTLLGQVTGGDDGGEAELTGTRIVKNALVDNGVGYHNLGAALTQVRGNLIRGNAEGGIIEAGNSDLMAGNTVTGNGSGAGISISGNGNRAFRNRVTGNAGDGIAVAGGTGSNNTVLEDNVASRNGDDGIDQNNALATIAGNTANDNGDYGIEAAGGVTDGGGNRARGNGNPAQCLNVTCK